MTFAIIPTVIFLINRMLLKHQRSEGAECIVINNQGAKCRKSLTSTIFAKKIE